MRIRPAVAFVAGGLLVSLLSTHAQAQYQGGNNQRNYPAFPSGGGGYGMGWGGFGGGGTAAGSYLHGMGDVVRSAGYANVMNSIARKTTKMPTRPNSIIDLSTPIPTSKCGAPMRLPGQKNARLVLPPPN